MIGNAQQNLNSHNRSTTMKTDQERKDAVYQIQEAEISQQAKSLEANDQAGI